MAEERTFLSMYVAPVGEAEAEIARDETVKWLADMVKAMESRGDYQMTRAYAQLGRLVWRMGNEDNWE